MKTVDWNAILAEGEKRITTILLDALIVTPPGDRTRLVLRREHVKRQMEKALKEKNAQKMVRALKGQIRLLSDMRRVVINPSPVDARSLSAAVRAV